MKANLKMLSILMISLIAGYFVACTKDDGLADGDKNGKGKGNVTFVLTDAPFPTDMVAEANVTIDKIEIQKMASESDTTDADTTSFIVLSEETMEFNLLDLRNGVTTVLVDSELEAGKYGQIRMHIVDAEVVLKEDGGTFDLKIRSGTSSGLKINIKNGLTVTDGSFATVVLDFDVSKSFIVQGNPKTKAGIKGFLFKPVVRAIVMEATGMIKGFVSVGDTIKVGNATVEIYQMDELITSALTDAPGYYAAIGLPVGSYDLKCLADGYVTKEVMDVSVSKSDTTTVDIQLEPSE